jgi:hypothetical protein
MHMLRETFVGIDGGLKLVWADSASSGDVFAGVLGSAFFPAGRFAFLESGETRSVGAADGATSSTMNSGRMTVRWSSRKRARKSQPWT